jgi:hypothetical protein
MTFSIKTPSSFNLAAVVRSHGWIQMPPFAETAHHGLSYVIRLSSDKVLRFEANSAGDSIVISTTELISEIEQAELRQTITCACAVS